MPKNLYYLLLILVIMAVAFIINRLIRLFLRKYFESESKLIKNDPTNYRFFQNAVSTIIFTGALFFIFYSIPELKSLGLTLFASAGIFAAIIGFASQQAFSNIISGIFIVMFKPFKVGDMIKIGTDISGVIEDITLRHTVIRNFENRRFIIPNSKISSDTILNSSISDERTCNFIEIGISYDSDVDKARQIIFEEVTNHPFNIDVRSEEDIAEGKPKVIIRVISYGDSSINIRAWAWANTPGDAFVLKCDVLESVKKRFDKEGVEIPFPYRTIVFKKDIQTTDLHAEKE